jgi:MFS family permease
MEGKGKAGVYYGWWVVIALLMIEAVGPMGRYSMAAFFPFIWNELGWSRSLVGSAQTMSLWVYALLVPLSGWMVDRIGTRRTLTIGGLLFLISWILLSTMKIPCQLYIYYGFIMGLAVGMCTMVPIQAAANKWFRKRAGLVTGLTSAAFGIGVSLFVPLVTNMASILGWRTTSVLWGVGSAMLIVGLSLFVIRDTPESMGVGLDGDDLAAVPLVGGRAEESVTPEKALKTSAFWLLFSAYSLLGIPLQGLLAHLVMWGVDLGTSKAVAGVFITAMFFPSIASKIGGGWLGDKLGRKKIMVVSQLACLCIMLWGWQGVHSSRLLTVFAVVMGLSYGIPMGLFTPYLADFFGRNNVGSLFGFVTLGHGVIGGCGPLLWGYIFDLYGEYNAACLVSAACYGGVVLALCFIKSGKRGSLPELDESPEHPCGAAIT